MNSGDGVPSCSITLFHWSMSGAAGQGPEKHVKNVNLWSPPPSQKRFMFMLRYYSLGGNAFWCVIQKLVVKAVNWTDLHHDLSKKPDCISLPVWHLFFRPHTSNSPLPSKCSHTWCPMRQFAATRDASTCSSCWNVSHFHHSPAFIRTAMIHTEPPTPTPPICRHMMVYSLRHFGMFCLSAGLTLCPAIRGLKDTVTPREQHCSSNHLSNDAADWPHVHWGVTHTHRNAHVHTYIMFHAPYYVIRIKRLNSGNISVDSVHLTLFMRDALLAMKIPSPAQNKFFIDKK